MKLGKEQTKYKPKKKYYTTIRAEISKTETKFWEKKKNDSKTRVVGYTFTIWY